MLKAIKNFLFGTYIQKGQQQPVTVVAETEPEVKAEPAVVAKPKSSGSKNTGKKPSTTTKKKKVNEQRGNQKKRSGN